MPSRADLMALTKARLSALVLLTTLAGYWLGREYLGLPVGGWLLFHTLLGTALCAAASSVFNQIMEMEADARMRRTADRPLPARRLAPGAAFAIGWLLAALGLVHLGLKVNFEAASLAAATLISYIFVYTPMKVRSAWNTAVGAVSGALPPMIGWAASAGAASESLAYRWAFVFAAPSLFLFALLFVWQLPHFLAINWMYRDEYIRGGFVMCSNSDPGGGRTAWLSLVSSVAAFALAFWPWLGGFAGIGFAIGAGLSGAALVLLALVFLRLRERSAARRLFFATLLYLPVVLGLLITFFRHP